MSSISRKRICATLLTALLVVACNARAEARQSKAPSSPELDRVAAFARLFGVVRFFYPSDAAAEMDWPRYAVHGTAMARDARDSTELARILKELTTPLGPGIVIARTLPPAAPPGTSSGTLVAWRYFGAGFDASRNVYSSRRTGRSASLITSQLDGLPVEAGDHADVGLGAGLWARVPLVLTDEEARTAERHGTLDALRAAVAQAPLAGDPPPLDVRLADVVVAWNVYRHFYPYWRETDVDWEDRLPALLQSAAEASSRAEHADALKGLVHDVRDGHGRVTDTSVRVARASLPAGLAVVEDHVVVTATAVPALPVGAVVLEIDGAPTATLLAGLLAHSSGTEQWRRARAGWELGAGTPGSDARLRIDDGQGVREVSVRRIETPPVEKRPEPVTELEPGIWYVDLTRAKMEQVQPSIAKLASAKAVVFDMRGYPTDSGIGVLPHLLEAAETDLWMHVWKLTGPFGRAAGWQDEGWNLKPAQPRIGGRRIFLTDGRAISYGESVMGYVGDRKLGTIVGGPTAGTNGNVATFDLPGGFRVSFTAMRVTRHDGKSVFHLVGVKPQVAVEPTIGGLRAGRDEVLEKGLELARKP